MNDVRSVQKTIENKQPSNLEAEQALLGSILVNNDIIDEISNIISSNIFYDPAHIKIYEVIHRTFDNNSMSKDVSIESIYEADTQTRIKAKKVVKSIT